MAGTVTQFNFFTAIGVAVLGVILCGLLVLFLLERFGGRQTLVGAYARRWGVAFVLLFSAVAAALTLVYSEVFGLVPCGLCWMQRVFLYPQIVVAGLALAYRDRTYAPLYLVWLSVIGLVIALYQHYLQMGGGSFLPCPAAAGDCAQRIVFEFGFITFPFMAATLFAFNIVVCLFVRHQRA